VEYFGVYSADTGKCYLVPVDAVPNRGCKAAPCEISK
jgi:hypothetical protein